MPSGGALELYGNWGKCCSEDRTDVILHTKRYHYPILETRGQTNIFELKKTMNLLMNRGIKTMSICTFCILFSFKTFAQAGILDSSFGDKGEVLTDVDGANDNANSVAIQDDGKYVVVGHSLDENNHTKGFLVCRYQLSGNLDSSFGINGKVITAFLGDNDFAYSVVIQSDKKIVVSGSSYGNIALVRYDSSGNIDPSFGEDGKILTPISGGQHIVIDSDDNLLVSANQFGLARFTPSGKLDSSFGINGLTGVEFAVSAHNASHVLQPDGRIIEVGVVGNDYMHSNYAVARFESNGKIDSTFGENGLVVTTFDNWASSAHSVGVLSDGKILVAGGVANYSTQTASFSIAKYRQNGSLDSSFGSDGKLVNTNLHLAEALSLILDDDKILLVGEGQTNVETMDGFGLIRLKATGEPDSAFGLNGETYTNFQEGFCIAFDGALQPDRKIVLVGRATINTKDYFALARYKNDATLAVSFLSFTAVDNEKSVMLNWQTGEEINNDYFIVQRSADPRFVGIMDPVEDLGFVKSELNSSQLKSYFFEDLHPLIGQNFYRLKQVDKDGLLMYSKIVSVDFQNKLRIVVYPNPASYTLNIDGLNSYLNNRLSIFDFNGKLVSKTETMSNHYSWNIRQLGRGIYYLLVESNNERATIKFTKQ